MDPRNCELHVACLNFNLKIMKLLLAEHNADPNIRNKLDQTPLHMASQVGFIQGVECLLKNGANMDAVDIHENTALHEAAKNGHRGVCDILVSLLPKRNKDNRSALHVAAEHGKLRCVELFLQEGADPDMADNEGVTPVTLAVTNNHDMVSQALINARKKQVNDSYGGNAEEANAAVRSERQMSSADQRLHKAAGSGTKTNLIGALDDGADVRSRDSKGNTAMHVAAKRGHLQCIGYLLQADGDPGAKNDGGDTPLHLACQNNHLEIVKRLVGEDTSLMVVKNGKGRTALQVAIGCDNKDIESFLKDNM